MEKCVNVNIEIEINSEFLLGKIMMRISEERWVSGLNHRFAKPAKLESSPSVNSHQS